MMQYYHAILNKADDIHMIAATTVSGRVVSLVRDKHPDVVLLDYAMYPVDGFKIMQAIHAEMPEMAVILLGGRDTLRDMALEDGAADYLSIPITPRDLLEAIRRVGRAQQSH
jgi:DNA-binding response OmpR family regulator